MNILIYAHSFAPHIGGAEKYVLLLAQGLAGRPEIRQVTVATPTPAGGFDDGALPFRVVRRPGPRTLWRLIGAADVVQLAGPCFVPLALALLRRKPVAIEHHGYQACCPNGLLFYQPAGEACPGHFQARRYGECLRCNAAEVGWFRSVQMLALTFPRRWMCRRAAANIAVTEHVARRLGLPRSRTIYYGIPAPPHPQVAARADGAACFAYVGRLVREKGLEVLLKAARGLRDRGCEFRLKLIGDGPERAALESLASSLDLGGRVTFTGFLRDEALRAELDQAAAVVMPSIWEETAGFAAIEQMMRGRAVIASDIGGLGEIVGDAGLKFTPGDPEALVRCLRVVAEDAGFATAIGERARARSLSLFGQEHMVQRHSQLYGALAGPNRNAA